MKYLLPIGSRVRYIGCNGRRQNELSTPPIGTIGTIVKYDFNNDFEGCFSGSYLIEWPKGTVREDRRGETTWYSCRDFIEPVEESDGWEERFGTVSDLWAAFQELEKAYKEKCELLNKAEVDILEERKSLEGIVAAYSKSTDLEKRLTKLEEQWDRFTNLMAGVE